MGTVRPMSRRALAPFVAATLSLPLAASALRAEPAWNLDRTTISLVEQFVAGDLTLERARSLADTGTTGERAGAYWSLAFGRGALVLVLPAEPEPAREADLTLTVDAGLRLKALEDRFGAWEPQHREKTSSVLFRLRSPQGGAVLVFAGLHTPRPSSGSPVIAIRLRRQ